MQTITFCAYSSTRKNLTRFKHSYQNSKIQNEDTNVNGFLSENIKIQKMKKKDEKN